jgi:hypothetical protein
LFPTILNFTGTKTPRGHVVDGAKLDTLLAGQRDRSRRERFLMHYPHAPHRSDYWTSYLDGDWKVIYHYFPSTASEDSHYQLFNLKTDPFEQQNLAGLQPAALRRMMRRLIAALEKHHAAYPVDNDGTTALRPKLP